MARYKNPPSAHIRVDARFAKFVREMAAEEHVDITTLTRMMLAGMVAMKKELSRPNALPEIWLPATYRFDANIYTSPGDQVITTRGK